MQKCGAPQLGVSDRHIISAGNFTNFAFRFLSFLRFESTDFDEINVYTHISGHAGSNGTLIFELFLPEVP